MQDFIDAFEKIELTNKTKSNEIKLQELIYLTIKKLQNEYLILPPSPTNIGLVNTLKDLYPNIDIYSEYNLENRQKNFTMFLLFKTPFVHKKTCERVGTFKRLLKDNTIIIKKSEEFNDFLEALKVTSVLSGQRAKKPSQLTCGPHHSSKITCYDNMAKLLTKIINIKGIDCVNVNADQGNVHIYFNYKPKLKPNFFIGKIQREIKEEMKQENNRLNELLKNVSFFHPNSSYFSGGLNVGIKEQDYFDSSCYDYKESYQKFGLYVGRAYGNSYCNGYFAIRNIPIDHFYNEMLNYVLKE